jgi:uroporphyrinogen decarboxylase
LESGAGVYHFGAGMDIAAALGRVGPETVLCGNLDTEKFFRKGQPQAAGEATKALLEATRGFRNFVVSSGCDIPPGSPLANLNAFYRAVAEFNK